jgi:HD-GYP domain-containing protein (c-di-GMP phosphodiesterase class II)
MSFDEAVEEMRSGAGRQWSRVLVDWLLQEVSVEVHGRAEAG